MAVALLLGGVRDAGRVEVRRDRSKRWSLTPEAFDKLLASLDADPETAGEKYEQVRGGLVCFFEWRGAPFPEDHADETLNRIARKLDEGDQVNDPFSYAYGVARLLLLEVYKSRERERAALAHLPAPGQPSRDDSDDDSESRRSDCLGQCLDGLPQETRELVTAYYQGERRTKIDNRKALADRLGIPLNALRLRARRLRERLEICVETCMNREGNR
jgi:DNA-directed RNA polymerase specialized sigma24 family protein